MGDKLNIMPFVSILSVLYLTLKKIIGKYSSLQQQKSYIPGYSPTSASAIVSISIHRLQVGAAMLLLLQMN